MGRLGTVLVFLLLGLLQIQTANCDTGAPATKRQRTYRPIRNPDDWEAVTSAQAQVAPFSSGVKLVMYNASREFSEPAPGIGRNSRCSGTVLAWNMVLTSAHCLYADGYPWDLMDVTPGGPLGGPGANGVVPTPFGTDFVFNDEEEVFVYPDFDVWYRLEQLALDSDNLVIDDVAIIVLSGPISKESAYPDATMKLSMVQSVAPDYDDPDGDTPYILEEIASDQVRFQHFPADYPAELKGWGRMHIHTGSSTSIVVKIAEDGTATFELNFTSGTSGSSIQELDATSEAAGGSASGARIRVLSSGSRLDDSNENSFTELGLGTALTPAHVKWIAWIMQQKKVTNAAELDSTLATGLETEVCMCTVTDTGAITVKMVAAPYDTHCLCPGGTRTEVTDPFAGDESSDGDL